MLDCIHQLITAATISKKMGNFAIKNIGDGKISSLIEYTLCMNHIKIGA